MDYSVAAGFTTVFEMMRDSNKPAVGHNLSFDLTFSLAAFAQQLPHSWLSYKQLVRIWLPGGVWDTKYLARELQVLFCPVSLPLLALGLLPTGLCPADGVTQPTTHKIHDEEDHRKEKKREVSTVDAVRRL